MIEVKVEQQDKIISKTDLRGNILSINDKFMKYTGLNEKEVMARPHNIIRHADMPKIAFRLLWAKLLDGQTVNAFVKNRGKNGKYYWVYATVSPNKNYKTGKIDSFYSIRKAPNREAVEQFEKIYKLLRDAEIKEGYEAAKSLLKSVLDANGMKFSELMQRVQAQGGEIRLP